MIILLCGVAHAGSGTFGAGVTSSYIWRGAEVNNRINVQPQINGSFPLLPNLLVSGGIWGSYSTNGYQEIDTFMSVGLPFGLSAGFTDYYFPDSSPQGEYFKRSSHDLEPYAAFTAKGVRLMYGNYERESYVEVQWNTGKGVSSVAGVGKGMNHVGIGISKKNIMLQVIGGSRRMFYILTYSYALGLP